MSDIEREAVRVAREVIDRYEAGGYPIDGNALYFARALLSSTRDEWKPIESAPRDGTPCLIIGWEYNDPASGKTWQAVATCDGGPWYEGSGAAQLHEPTHWQPLPAPPVSKEPA